MPNIPGTPDILTIHKNSCAGELVLTLFLPKFVHFNSIIPPSKQPKTSQKKLSSEVSMDRPRLNLSWTD
jgi:hypothetical protein